ncbi:MAG TPA: helix-turn-helix domain-containing protein [Ktedonobacterales bacterium]
MGAPQHVVSASGPVTGPVTVRELLPVLQQWQARLLSGEQGLSRTVTWASTMRARLPAFESFQGGELALFSLATLRALRSHLVAFSLPAMVDQLAEMGASALAVGGLEGATLSPQDAQGLEEAKTRSNERGIPLIALPPLTPLDKVEAAIINAVVARRGRQAASHPAPDPLAARFRASLRGEALDALLSGTYAGEPQMRARAAQLGHDLSHPYIPLWVELDARSASNSPTPLAVAEAAPQATALAETLEGTLGAWTRARGWQVVALVPQSRLQRGPLDMAERLQGMLPRLPGASGAEESSAEIAWACGVGEPAIGPAHLRRSATEARDAARLGFLVLGPGRVARMADLGVYQLLLTLRESGDLESFVARTLAPFERDPRDREQHFQTLEAYFACRGNVTKAAEQLHMHRNSLLYRLGNIRKLFDRELEDPELLLALQLALKGRHVLEL